MTQTLYAHMNNKKTKIYKVSAFQQKQFEFFLDGLYVAGSLSEFF
jgi:hypothetical protein